MTAENEDPRDNTIALYREIIASQPEEILVLAALLCRAQEAVVAGNAALEAANDALQQALARQAGGGSLQH